VSVVRPETWRLVALVAVLAAGCDFPGRPNPADRPVPANQVKDFDTLYGTRCAGCHGADGKLGPAPPLNDPLFVAIVPDDELLKVISNGRSVSPTQRTPMPAFLVSQLGSLTAAQVKARAELDENHPGPQQLGPLTDEQVQVLAQGIKKSWKAAAPSKAAVPPYLASTKGGSGNKEQGARVFARACAGCHGENGKGDDSGTGQGAAINNPAFLALISDQALRRIAITGRPDLGMPPFEGTDGRSDDFKPLTSDEINDLVALLADWRQGDSTKHD
jgi:cytochrome c oxidase cbb3-type subunit III